MAKGNFIVLYRKFLKWEWYDDLNVKTLFLHCLLSANWETKKWRGYTIERGSFITSWAHLAKDTGLTVQQVRTACEKLERTGEVTRKQQGSNSIITVKNYGQYQDYNKEITREQQGSNKEVTTTNNNKQLITINKQINNKDINCFNVDFSKTFKIYQENCSKLIKLSFEKRARNVLTELAEFLEEIEYDFDYVKRLCDRANELEFIVDKRIDFRSLIRNHIGIMNGKYAKTSTIGDDIKNWSPPGKE